MAEVRRVIRNPDDEESGYKQWSNGYPEPFGDALPTGFTTRWGDRAVDLWIYDWEEPAGLVGTDDGARHGFGGAPGSGGPFIAGVFEIYRYFVNDPTGSGRGFFIDRGGDYEKYGTGTPNITPAPPIVGSGKVRDFQMDYASGKWAMLLEDGTLYASFTVTGKTWVVKPGRAVYRSLLVLDWTVTQPPLYVADYAGSVFAANGAEDPNRGAILTGQGDILRDFSLISDGTGGDPLIIVLDKANGASKRYIVSDPPTVTVVAPTGTITDTTRPEGVVDYDDPNGDSAVRSEVAWFTDAQYGIGGFNPASSPATERQTITERDLFAATPTVDLLSDTYRMYWRAQDSAGQWSTWAHGTFTVDVTAPDTPTITATPWDDYTIRLVVADGEESVEIEFSDDAETWVALRSSPVEPDATTYDREPQFNLPRQYRARSVVGDLRSQWSTVATATLVELADWVLSIPSGDYLVVDVPRGLTETIPNPVGVYTPGDAYDATVIRSLLRSPRFTLTLRYFDLDHRQEIYDLLASRTTLLLRSPYRITHYVDIAGDVERVLSGMISLDEGWGSYSIPVVAVARP